MRQMFMNIEMRMYMKKKLFSVLLVAAMTASLVACDSKKKDTDKTPSTVNAEIDAAEYAGTITSNADVYKKYVTVPEWKGISVDCVLSDYVVTDKDVEDYINSMLETTATTNAVTTGTTKSGDVITLDYSGKLDGTAFSGGTATDVTYTIGSGKLIDDLDKGLAGLTVGKETDIPCKFPDDYFSSDLAGKNVIFTVTVKNIQETVVPELSDEWVVANATKLGLEDDSLTTVDQLRDYIKSYLDTQAASAKASEIFESAYSAMIEGLDVTEYPSEELEELLKTLNSNVDAEYESYSSSYSSKEEYLKSAYGFETLDAFNEYAEDYAKQYLLQKMIITIIAADNNITVEAEEINSTGEELAAYYGYNGYQEILDTYGKEMNSEIGYQVLYQKVTDYICENVTINDTSTAE